MSLTHTSAQLAALLDRWQVLRRHIGDLQPEEKLSLLASIAVDSREMQARCITQLRVAPGRKLTSREAEVVALLVSGHTTKEVAIALSVSVKTVEAHKLKIYGKLGIHSMGELHAYWWTNVKREAVHA